MILSNFYPVLTIKKEAKKIFKQPRLWKFYEMGTINSKFVLQPNTTKKDEPQTELYSLEKNGLWIKQG